MRGIAVRILFVTVWLTATHLAAAFGAEHDNSSSKAQPARGVVVSATNPAVVPDEGLRIALVGIIDERCPIELRCVWAGHAAVTLNIELDGQPAETVVIGTVAVPEIKLRPEAEVGPYRFTLLRLQPRNSAASKPALSQYAATVLVAKR